MKNKKTWVGFIAILAVIGLTITACGGKFRSGSTWIVKAADGSGNVQLYKAGSKDTIFVPDGTEVVVQSKSWKNQTSVHDIDFQCYDVRFENTTYFINEKELSEENAEFKTAREESKKSNRNARSKRSWLAILGIAVAVATFYMLNKMSKPLAAKAYKAYYEKKRAQHTWLDNWLKNKKGNIAEKRAIGLSGTAVAIGIVVFVVLMVIGYFIGFSFVFYIVSLSIGIAVTLLLGLQGALKPGSLEPILGLTLECPSCHCPHAWAMTQNESIVTGGSTTKTTTTTVRESFTYAGVYHTDTKTKVNKEINGKSIRDFKCLNCGHTEHKEYNEYWNKVPEVGCFEYNPPVSAWDLELQRHGSVYE